MINQQTSLSKNSRKPSRGGAMGIQLVHSKRDSKPKLLNPHQRESISTRCLIHGVSRWTVMREYGVDIREVNEICDRAMYNRGFQAGRNAERFSPVDSPRTAGRRAA